MATSYRAHILYRQPLVTYRGIAAFTPSLLDRDARYHAERDAQYHAERSRISYQALCFRRTYRTTSVS